MERARQALANWQTWHREKLETKTPRVWESPAFDAGVTAGAQIIAVNGRAYTADELKQAVVDAESGGPIELVVKSGSRVRATTLAYHGGLRHPYLEPIPGARRRIDEIYAPK